MLGTKINNFSRDSLSKMGFISQKSSPKFKNENVSYDTLGIKKSKIKIEILTSTFQINMIYIILYFFSYTKLSSKKVS